MEKTPFYRTACDAVICECCIDQHLDECTHMCEVKYEINFTGTYQCEMCAKLAGV